LSFRAWIRREDRKIRRTEGRGALQQQAYMLQYRREYRPKMWTRLRKLGAHTGEDYAVLNTQMWESAGRCMRAGMGPTDA